MDKIRELMGKKILGVPAIYIVGLFVVILALVAWKMKPAADPSADSTADEESQSEGNPTTSGQPVFVANPRPVYTDADGNESTDSSGVDTNDKWLRRSIEWVSANKGIPVDEVQVALQAYLRGDQLTTRQGQIRDFAIAHYGLPPELVESGGTKDETPPDSSTPNTSRPPTYYTVTGNGDNTWGKLCQKFYGSSDNVHIDYLQSWNVRSGAPHSGTIPKGTRIWIPAYKNPKYITATASMRTAAQIIAKNPPLNSTAMLQELNDGMKFPVKVGTRVRVL